jgi:protease II
VLYGVLYHVKPCRALPYRVCCWLLCAQFYTVKDHLDRPYKVLRHNINAAAGSTDEVVYEETDEVCVCVGGCAGR